MKANPRRKVKKSDRLTITLGEDQRRWITEIARQRRTSVATVIRWAVDRYITDSAEGPARTQSTPRGSVETGHAE